MQLYAYTACKMNTFFQKNPHRDPHSIHFGRKGTEIIVLQFFQIHSNFSFKKEGFPIAFATTQTDIFL